MIPLLLTVRKCRADGGHQLMLDPEWIAQNHSRFDVFHLHFGFDAISTDALRRVIDELARHGKPLVYTVHDLRNPHQPDPGPHDKQLDVLVRAADELITLTAGAAEVIRERWGRSALVHPHPHVLDEARIRRTRPASADFVVGVHVKSLRANMDPFPVLDTLVETVGDLGDATLQINLHDEIFDPDNHFYAPQTGARLLDYARHPHLDVRVHPYFTEHELWQYLSSLRASVLPYRFGTHSGWLEACFDLGTEVIAPSCGFYANKDSARSSTTPKRPSRPNPLTGRCGRSTTDSARHSIATGDLGAAACRANRTVECACCAV